jgi:hypothetical protein
MVEFERFKFQRENLKAPSEHPIFQSQTTGVRIQRIDPPIILFIKSYNHSAEYVRKISSCPITSHGAFLDRDFVLK